MAHKKKRSGAVLKYVLLPGVLPRCRNVFRTGFHQIAFLLASLYNTIGLLPSSHPYLNAANQGRFGILNVIGEASNNLVLDRKNIDKLVMFIVTLVGLALLVMQFVVFALAIVMAPAMATAQPISFQNIFTLSSSQAETDLAYIGLDMVFGVPDMFRSCIQTGAACSSDPADQILQGTGAFPWPFHIALHSMFQLYSLGLLVVAVMILLYFVIAVVAETAQSGTPFGRRFNQVWAPLRLVVALGLLVPLASGLNAGQYITLYMAKFGSAMATNAWINFNYDLSAAAAGNTGTQNHLLGNGKDMVGKPNPPRVQTFLQFLHVAKACEIAEERHGYRITSGGTTTSVTSSTLPMDIDLYLVRSNGGSAPSAAGCSYSSSQRHLRLANTTHDCAWHFFDGRDVIVRVGEYDPGRYPDALANVSDHCGQFVIPMINPTQPTGQDISEGYFDAVRDLWDGAGGSPVPDFRQVTVENFFRRNVTFDQIDADPAYQYDDTLPGPPSSLKLSWTQDLTEHTERIIETAYGNLAASLNASFNANLREKGWAGAAIWYNKLAELNGLFLDVATSYPYATAYPSVMEHVAEQRLKQNNNPSGDKYELSVEGNPISFESVIQNDEAKYRFYYSVYDYWATDPITGAGSFSTPELVGTQEPTGNPFIDAINVVFGTVGLFDMRENADVHPLAQLANIGKGIMNSTVFMMLAGVGGIVGQGAFSLYNQTQLPAEVAGIVSNITFSVAAIGLTAGFVLFYILPFMPFIYFFFAVIGWIKGIFEAMVGVPLWALAHIRIDGQGLPGDAAINGYFLLLEIMVRPILILFGMLASITIFAAAVQILNAIFDLVVANLAGTNLADAKGSSSAVVNTINSAVESYRGPVDQLFYTVIYAVIVYLIGVSCFKMIDNIPNNILRWAGQSVSSFNDQRKDAAEGLMQYAAIGGVQIFGQATQGLKSVGDGSQKIGQGIRKWMDS